MFGFSLLIIAASALLGTGLAALGLRFFFRIIEPNGAALSISSSDSTNIEV